MAYAYDRYCDIIDEIYVYASPYKQATGMTLGACCYFDCVCICCVIKCGGFYVHFMCICYEFYILIITMLLAYSDAYLMLLGYMFA